MFAIKTINNISASGIEYLEKKGCEVAEDIDDPVAILVRSEDLHQRMFNASLLAIGRAGAGYNNIPVKDCAEQGIVVFNSPGANAEAVKELELCSLVMASRDVLGSIEWVRSVTEQGESLRVLTEKNKGNFAGPELMGKTIGVLGLGAVGALVANAAVDLGMQVLGYDPFLSVDAAWRLSRDVVRADTLEEILRASDYISLNVPYNQTTYHYLSRDQFQSMKPGVRIINESRDEVVDNEAMLEALHSGIVAKYVTDFPNELLIGEPNVITMPHLGACTPESEDRCAYMAANQIYDYLVNGNIKNSVNLPDVTLNRMGACRLCVIHRNIPGMINRILDFITAKNINVEHMINKPRESYAYTIVDLGDKLDIETELKIRVMPDVLRVRVL